MKIILLICLLVLGLYSGVGNNAIFREQMKLTDAIYSYRKDCYKNVNFNGLVLVDYKDVKDWNLLDCILPWRWKAECYISADKFEIIKEYINE